MWKASPVQGTVAVLFSLASTMSLLFWCTELSYLKLQQELLRLVQLAWFSFNSWHLRIVYIRILQKKNLKQNMSCFSSFHFTGWWEGGTGHVPCMCKELCFPKESWLVVRGSLTLLSAAGPTLSLSPSKNGVFHRSLKLLNGLQRVSWCLWASIVVGILWSLLFPESWSIFKRKQGVTLEI